MWVYLKLKCSTTTIHIKEHIEKEQKTDKSISHSSTRKDDNSVAVELIYQILFVFSFIDLTCSLEDIFEILWFSYKIKF